MPVCPPTLETVFRAAGLLRSGGLVAFPTETVYGLGADARNGQAVAKIYEMKGRPAFNPLIVHVADWAAAERIAVFDDRARHAAQVFWPGPLTLVLPLSPESEISPLVTAGLDTVAVRCPSHSVARALLQASGVPIAAPSANQSGTLSPTTPMHVRDSLKNDDLLILAGGAAQVGLESTILDLSGPDPVILRPGAVTAEDLQSVLGKIPVCAPMSADEKTPPRSPGLLLRHYAPRVPVRLNAVDLNPGEALLAFGSDCFMGIRGGGDVRSLPESARRNLSSTGDLTEAAANLFAYLHDLDRLEHAAIAVMAIPDQGLGLAINDRLRRAARGESPARALAPPIL